MTTAVSQPVRLAILSTHPIQYYAPLFKQLTLSGRVSPRVFFSWEQTGAGAVHDPGFARLVKWDIPLLDGYESQFVPNVAARPGTSHFRGLRNPTLIPTLESWRPEALLVFGWNNESHLRVLRHFRGKVPIFFRGDSTLLGNRPNLRTLARRLTLRWIYRHIDVAIAVGSNNKDYFRWCGVPEDRIAHAPHAVDTARFADPDGLYQSQAGIQLRSMGIRSDERVLLFAGKFIVEKDCLLLLEAFLGAAVPGHLVMVGNGPFEEQLRARAAGRTDVHFLPFQNQQAMPMVYRLGDAYVLPSRSETWGLALNEAMACGRPVIASSQVGGARDLVTDRVNGWIFESGNLGQLIAVIREVLGSPAGNLREMGAAAWRDSARSSIEIAADGIARAVTQFVANRPEK
jgi:glycosyltransferase involved in cell wall biosynthesis